MCPIRVGRPKRIFDGCKRPRKFNADRQRAFPINLQLPTIARVFFYLSIEGPALIWLTYKAFARMEVFEHINYKWGINGA